MSIDESYSILKEILFNSLGLIDANKNRAQYMTKHYPEIWYVIKSFDPEISSPSEFMWLYEHNFKKEYCPVCGKKLKFFNYTIGYKRMNHSFCSKECAHSDKGKKLWRDAGKKTCVKKYGGQYPFFSKEVQAKITDSNIRKYGMSRPKELEWETKKKRRTINTSKIQEACYKHLCNIFGKEDVQREYKDSIRYPWHCDFYICSLDLFIEIQGNWTHGMHPFDENDKNDLEVLEIMKQKSKNSLFYENAVNVWSNSDVIKRRKAKEMKLRYFEYFGNDVEIFKEKLKEYINNIDRLSSL